MKTSRKPNGTGHKVRHLNFSKPNGGKKPYKPINFKDMLVWGAAFLAALLTVYTIFKTDAL